MRPLQHVFYGLITSLVLWYSIPAMGFYGFLTIFLTSFLLDVDHYISYAVMNSNLSLKKAYWFFTHHPPFTKHHAAPLNIFHTVEVLILLIILSWNNQFFFFIWAGWMIHYALDVIQTFVINNNPYDRQYSVIWYLIKKH